MLIGCPQEQIDAETWEMCTAADLAKEGSWPNGKGWLDETASCVTAVQWVWADDSRHKAELEAGR